jgi:hypothetical protein
MSDQTNSKYVEAIIAMGPAALLAEEPPIECPIAMPRKDEQRLKLLTMHQVPLRLRALLAHVVNARYELNRRVGPSIGKWQNPQLCSTQVEETARFLNAELRRQETLVDDAVIEYHADWRYSWTTLETERTHYEAMRKEASGTDKAPEQGPSHDLMRKWPDPPCHLLGYYLSQNDRLAYERAIGRDRKKKPS